MDFQLKNNECIWKYLNEEQKYKFYYDGIIWSCITNKFLTPCFNKNTNVWRVNISIKRKIEKTIIHTTFYKLFKGEIKKGYYISFKDGNHKNCHVDNLIQVPKNSPKMINNNSEEWKDALGYEGRYAANKEGQIKTFVGNNAGQILQDNHSKKYKQSYIQYSLSNKEGYKTSKQAHILVWTAFNGPIPKGLTIDHINRNKLDNRLENLRLATKEQQMKNRIVKPNNTEIIPILNENFKNIGMYKKFDFSGYEINEYGQVRTLKRKLLYQQDFNEYKQINLKDKISKTRKSVRIHQIVASVFIPNPNTYPEVNHKDKNRSNNHISNLEWVNKEQQMIHALGKKVSQYSLEEELIATFESISQACKSIQKKNGGGDISNVCNGKRKTAYGFIWKWTD